MLYNARVMQGTKIAKSFKRADHFENAKSEYEKYSYGKPAEELMHPALFKLVQDENPKGGGARSSRSSSLPRRRCPQSCRSRTQSQIWPSPSQPLGPRQSLLLLRRRRRREARRARRSGRWPDWTLETSSCHLSVESTFSAFAFSAQTDVVTVGPTLLIFMV